MTQTYDLTFRRGLHHDPEPCRRIGFVCGGEHGPPVWEIETPQGERIYVAPENVEDPRHD
jgi:hypothetical protein